jgi:hypothetical protein
MVTGVASFCLFDTVSAVLLLSALALAAALLCFG